jgi:hypothetical protein
MSDPLCDVEHRRMVDVGNHTWYCPHCGRMFGRYVGYHKVPNQPDTTPRTCARHNEAMFIAEVAERGFMLCCFSGCADWEVT